MNAPLPRSRARLLLLLLNAACGSLTPVGMVDGAMQLPRALREVSAVVAIDAHTVVCVQDEAAALYRVELGSGTVGKPLRFGERGDYEGLAAVGADWWALRSEGVLVHVRADGDRLMQVGEHRLPGGHPDWEGLCWDADRAQLLAMPKVRLRDSEDDRRPVYAFDPQRGDGPKEPFLVFHRLALLEQLGWLEAKPELACSDLLVVPGRREVLLLSAVDRLLMRVDFDGTLLGATRLDRRQLPKPEGITLLPDGTVLVASEGRGGSGMLVTVPMP